MFCVWGRREVHTGFLWGNLREGDHFGRLRSRREDNIKIYLRDVGWRCLDWIDLAQDRGRRRAVVNAVMNLRVP